MIPAPTWLIAVPLLVAFLTPLLPSDRVARIIAPFIMVFELVMAFLLYLEVNDGGTVVEHVGNRAPPLGIVLVVDRLSAFFLVLFGGVGVMASVYVPGFREANKRFVMLFLLLVASAMGVVVTGDIFNMFVFLEIAAISSYALTASGNEKHGFAASLRFLILGSVASTFILVAIALIYGHLGTLNLAQIGASFGTLPSTTAVVILGLLVIGLAVEAELFPMNTWVPDVYRASPTPVTIVFASMMSKMGIYAMARILFTVAGADVFPWWDTFMNILLAAAVVTVLVGEMGALKQTDLKRQLAFSSMGQAGFIMFAVFLHTEYALTGALFLVLSHTFAKVAMFSAADTFRGITGTYSIEGNRGVGRKVPAGAAAFTLGALSLVGIPLLPGFWGKVYVMLGAMPTGVAFTDPEPMFRFVLIFLVMVGFMAEILYLFRTITVIYDVDGGKEETVSSEGTPTTDEGEPTQFSGSPGRSIRDPAHVVMLLSMTLLLLFGLMPEAVSDIFAGAIADLDGKAEYIATILGGA